MGFASAHAPWLANDAPHRWHLGHSAPSYAAGFWRAVAALRGQFGGVTLLPLWPRASEAAKMVILSARKGSKAPDRVLFGLVLHDEGGITAEAQAVLREGKEIGFFDTGTAKQ